MEDRPVSPETLAAQALGEADPVTGALAPVITLATNYEQRPDGSYPQGRVYTSDFRSTRTNVDAWCAAMTAHAITVFPDPGGDEYPEIMPG